MKPIPADILLQYSAVLKKRSVPASRHADYRKWLLYYLDFRNKYPLPDSRSEHVRLFIEKLQDKRQAPEQQKQAAHALSLFFETGLGKNTGTASSITKTADRTGPLAQNAIQEAVPPESGSLSVSSSEEAPLRSSAQGTENQIASKRRFGSRFNEWRCLEKSQSPDWDKLITDLAAEIKTRHYSRKTLKTYADWSRKFQSYLKDKAPSVLSSAEVKDYLTHLAVDCKVSASTQNQAFNALLFLYRHILKKDFGTHKDIPRAKRSTYIPVVLSRQEIEAVLKHLRHPYDLFFKLLYGCGLRLFEGVKLRVKDFNFDDGMLNVRGKGNKSRTVPIPQRVSSELRQQLAAVGKLHDQDCASGFAGVFMEDQLDKKYPKAAKDFIWQWFFPQESLTHVDGVKEQRRHHLHETHVQEAL
jgi:integrase